MNETEVFLDTNIILYLLSEDQQKADLAEGLCSLGGMISVQVLNEFVAVALRKLKLSWLEIYEILNLIKIVCPVADLTIDTHNKALQLAERYRMPIYDALIVAAALLNGCTKLYSEDMQNGLVVERTLVIHNPFLLDTGAR